MSSLASDKARGAWANGVPFLSKVDIFVPWTRDVNFRRALEAKLASDKARGAWANGVPFPSKIDVS